MNSREKVLLWGSNIWNFADGMLGPFIAVFTERIGGSILDISWAWAIYLVATGLFSIIVGRISDRYHKETLMILGYGLTAFFTFGYLLVSAPVHLFIIQAGLGVALALANPTWYALYGQYASPEAAGYAWGLADGEGKILTGLAVLAGGFIVSAFSFEVLFVTMGVVHVLATVFQAQILRQRRT